MTDYDIIWRTPESSFEAYIEAKRNRFYLRPQILLTVQSTAFFG